MSEDYFQPELKARNLSNSLQASAKTRDAQAGSVIFCFVSRFQAFAQVIHIFFTYIRAIYGLIFVNACIRITITYA